MSKSELKNVSLRRTDSLSDYCMVKAMGPPPLIRAGGPEKTEEKKEDETPLAKLSVKDIPRLPGNGKGFRADRHARYVLFAQSNVTTNAGASKYLQTFNTNATIGYAAVAAAVELTSLDALYDEVYVHSMRIDYIPRNKRSANFLANTSATAAGSPGDVNTCAAVVAFLPHNAPAYTDSSSAWTSMRSQPDHKLVDMGERWSIVGRNREKFSWDAPIGDQTTSKSTMGWVEFSAAGTLLGGFFQLATPVATGASIGIGALPESAVWGDVSITYQISVRARG